MNTNRVDDTFVALYEDLRCQALNDATKGSRLGLGLSMFIRRGMIIWMESWSLCAPKVSVMEMDRVAPIEQLQQLPFNDEVVNILTTMALSYQ